HIAAGKTAPAALSLRAVQQSLDQIRALNTSLTQMGPNLQQASSELAKLKAELQQDVAMAEDLTAKAHNNGDLIPSVQQLEQMKQQVQTALAGAQGKNPIAELATLEQLNIQLDGLFANTKNQLLGKQRLREHLLRTLSTAQAAISEADAFITTRRGAVEVNARTHFTEATRLFAEAQRLSTSQPEQALQYANQAIMAAQNATRMASSDVYSRPGYSSTGGGAELGGILGPILGGIIG